MEKGYYDKKLILENAHDNKHRCRHLKPTTYWSDLFHNAEDRFLVRAADIVVRTNHFLGMSSRPIAFLIVIAQFIAIVFDCLEHPCAKFRFKGIGKTSLPSIRIKAPFMTMFEVIPAASRMAVTSGSVLPVAMIGSTWFSQHRHRFSDFGCDLRVFI